MTTSFIHHGHVYVPVIAPPLCGGQCFRLQLTFHSITFLSSLQVCLQSLCLGVLIQCQTPRSSCPSDTALSNSWPIFEKMTHLPDAFMFYEQRQVLSIYWSLSSSSQSSLYALLLLSVLLLWHCSLPPAAGKHPWHFPLGLEASSAPS